MTLDELAAALKMLADYAIESELRASWISEADGLVLFNNEYRVDDAELVPVALRLLALARKRGVL